MIFHQILFPLNQYRNIGNFDKAIITCIAFCNGSSFNNFMECFFTCLLCIFTLMLIFSCRVGVNFDPFYMQFVFNVSKNEQLLSRARQAQIPNKSPCSNTWPIYPILSIVWFCKVQKSHLCSLIKALSLSSGITSENNNEQVWNFLFWAPIWPISWFGYNSNFSF